MILTQVPLNEESRGGDKPSFIDHLFPEMKQPKLWTINPYALT